VVDSVALFLRAPFTLFASYSLLPYYLIKAIEHVTPPLSPAYLPDPIELDEHVPVYVPETEYPEYLEPPADDIVVEDQPHANDDEDPEEKDPKEEDPKEEESDDNVASKKEPSKGFDDTKSSEASTRLARVAKLPTMPTLPPSPLTPMSSPLPQISSPPLLVPSSPLIPSLPLPLPVHVETHSLEQDVAAALLMLPSTTRRSEVPEADMPPRKRLCFATHIIRFEVGESSAVVATRPPRDLYGFVDTTEIEASITRRHVRTLHDTERRMMIVVELVNLRVRYEAQTRQRDSEEFRSHLRDAQRDRVGIRAEIVALRDRGTLLEDAYIELHEDLLSQSRDVTQALEARAQIDPMEDAGIVFSFSVTIVAVISGTEGVVGLSCWFEKMESIFHISGCAVGNQVKFATCTMLDVTLTYWNRHVRTLGHDAADVMTWETLKKKLTDKYCPKELALICTKFLADKTEKVDKYISGLPDNIHGNVISTRPKTLDEAIELTNDLMDQKLHTYAERQNDNKRKAESGHFKKNCPKLKNNDNANGNGRARGKAYVLGGGDSNVKSNIITGTFLLNNRYASISIDAGTDRSFISTAFSALLNIAPTALDNHYDVELTDGKIIKVNTILRCCTLDFLNHPFNIDLIPVPLGCDVFLAHVTMKEAEEKLEGKRLEDVLIVKDFPKVFPEDLLGIPPARQVEFQIDLVPEQTDGEAMINTIKHGDQPLPRVTQVSIAGTSLTEQPPLKDKFMWSDKEKKIQKIDRLARSLLIQGLSNDIYSLIDSNKTAKDLWDALARHMLGFEYGEQDRKAAVFKNLMDINIDSLYNIIKQNQRDVNDAMGLKKKTVVVTSDPLALIVKKTKKDKDEQVLWAENHAWMESSGDSNQEINANMVFMAQIEKVLSDSEASSLIQKIDCLARSLLIQRLSNDIYSLINSNKTAKDSWDALARHMLGSYRVNKIRKLQFCIMINDLKKCGYSKDNCELNFKFLNNLQPEWKQYATMMRQNKNLMDINIDALYKHSQGKPMRYSEGSEADDFSELKKITALLAKAFNRRKFYSKPTNNNLRTLSISQSANKKQEFVKTDNKKVEKKDDEKKRDMSIVKCYN
nr:reverse transcriptase domain-containing protein [Tanacetum cinerariifolium]